MTEPAEDRLSSAPLRTIRRVAKQADRLRRRNPKRFGTLAARYNTTTRRLRLLADAWTEGGRAGVDAIGPAITADPEIFQRAEEVVERWRRRHYPLDSLVTDVWRNRLTVSVMVTGDSPTDPLTKEAFMQLRRTGRGRWHLYRLAFDGSWWPVVVHGHRRKQSLQACLDAVRRDPLNQFWARDQPPPDRLKFGS